MTGTGSPPRGGGSPGSPNRSGKLLETVTVNPPNRTVMDAFEKTSWVKKEPEIGFGTSTRPPLNQVDGGPGPGAYAIKTTMGKVMESHLRTPSQFSIRGRTKFGDPNEKALSKTASLEPG